jgi:hypothetical protein
MRTPTGSLGVLVPSGFSSRRELGNLEERREPWSLSERGYYRRSGIETMSRLQVTVLAVIVLLSALFLLVRFTHTPVAVVCDRGRPNVKLTSTNKHGYFVEHHIGPCVTYTHKVKHETG